MPWARPPCTWPSTISGLTTVADVIDAHVGADLDEAGLGVDLGRAQVGAVREGEVVRVVGGVGVDGRLDAVGQVVRGERGQRDLGDRDALVRVAADREPPGDHSRSSADASSIAGRDHLGLLDHLVAGRDQGHAADRQRPGAVGVHALGRDLGVAVQHPDVLERHAELVGDDLAPRRLVSLAVRARSGDDLDLAGGQHPDRGLLPAAGAVGQRAEHPGRGQAAHLGEGGDADAELHRVVAGPPLLLLLAELVVVEQLLGLGRGRLVVTRVVGQAGDGGVRELLVLDPVPLPQRPAGRCRARRRARP